MKKKPEDTYILLDDYKSDNFHIRVFKPIISEEENERRRADLKKAAEQFLISYQKNVAKKERQKANAR